MGDELGEKISKYRAIEEDLHDSNKKYHNLVESSHELIQSVDKNGHFIFVNKVWRDTLGYSKKDLSRLTLFDIIHPDCMEYCKNLFKKVVSGENVSDIETKFVTKTGKSVYVEGNASPNIRNGEFVSTFGFFRDVTDHKQKDVELRENNEKMNIIFENVKDIIVFVDRFGKILSVNKKVEDILGYKPEEVLGKNFSKFGIIRLKELPKIVKLFRDAIKADRNTIPLLELDLKHKNGTWITVEAGTTVLKKDGKTIGTLNILRDITEHVEAKERKEQLIHSLKFLSESSMKFVEITPEENIHQLIADQIYGLLGNCYALVNSYDISSNTMELKATTGIGKQLNTVLKILGRDLIGMSFIMTDDFAKSELTKGKIVKVPGGIHVLSFGKLPKKACSDIEKVLGIREIYSMGFARGGKLYGNAVILLRNDFELKDTEIVETFMRQASVALQRRQAEQALKESEGQLRDAQQIAHTGSWNWNIKTEDLKWSDETFRIYGFKPQEFVPTFKIFKEVVHPDDLKFVQGEINAALQNKRRYNVDFRFIRPDKKIGWIHCEGRVTRDGKGNPLNFFGTQIDITERKKAEESLRESERKYKDMIELAPDGIVTTDLKGTVLTCNTALEKITGYPNDEIIGKNFTKLPTLKARDLPKYLKILGSVIQGKVPKPFEVIWLHGDGTEHFAEVHISLMKKEGKKIGLQIMVRDITERKKADEKIKRQNIQLKKLDELKTAFLNITSHELRTPMSSIKGYGQMLLKQTLGKTTEEQKQSLEVILRNTNRLDNLIRDILDVSRLESGTMKFIPKKTDIKTMVEQTAESMLSYADRMDITINADVKEDTPYLFIDEERIKQVMMNLVNNAIKFSPDGSIVNVRARKEKDDVLFEVQDFGRGIPTDKQDKIFQTFYQVDSSLDRKFGGAGLGLAISRGIVLAHGGKIWVESKEGKGSTFRFTIPIKPVKDMEGRFKDVDLFALEDDAERVE